VFGNEARGLSDQHRALADLVVRVPIYGHAESLNLAMAATVCLYASAFALRGKPTPAPLEVPVTSDPPGPVGDGQ
jgi:TrmH family RNA methyltransferase